MNLLNTIVKKIFVISILFIVGITMSFGVMTDDVAAASKKPSKVKITSIQSYDYNAIKITWKKATNAKKYQVYRASSKNGTYKLIKTTTSRSYINKSLTTGKKYYYKVRAVNGSKKGAFSYKKYATPTLKKTYGVKATANNYNTVTVSWNKVNGAKGYILYRATSKNGTYKKVKSTTATSYKVTGLTTGKTYYYKVRAYRYVNNKCKYGKYSAVISKTTALSAPKVSAQLNSKNQITVSWGKVSGAEKYKVYRATSSNGSYTAVKTTQLTSYVDTSAKASTKYYYKVKTVRGNYLSSYSNTVNCKWEIDLETIRTTMLTLINKERKAAGVEPIEMHEPLHCTAQEKAEDLYATGVFDHYSDNLGWFYDQYEKAGIVYYGGGENIAYGQLDVTSVMESWMQSKGHKANILGENWTHVGIGYYKGNWVQQFIESPYKEESGDAGESGDENKPVVGTCTCEAKSRAIQLIWDPIDGVDEYEVWRATELDGEYECIVDGLMSPNWYDNNLTPGQTYYYKIYARGYSEPVYTPFGTVPELTHNTILEHDWKPMDDNEGTYNKKGVSTNYLCNNCNFTTDSKKSLDEHFETYIYSNCGAWSSGQPFTIYQRVDTGEYVSDYICECGETRFIDLESFGLTSNTNSNCKCVANERIISLVWEKADNVEKYEVWRSTEENSGYVCIADEVTEMKIHDKGLAPGQRYFYKVYGKGASEPIYRASAVVPGFTHESPRQHDWKPVIDKDEKCTTVPVADFLTCKGCNFVTKSIEAINKHLDKSKLDDCYNSDMNEELTLYKYTNTGEYISEYICKCGATRHVDLESFNL